MTRLATFATAFACLASAAIFPVAEAQTPSSALEVLASGHPVTPLTVAGRGPYRFIVDTAATRTSLLSAFRKAHGASAEGRLLSIAGASGAAEVRVVALDGLEVAGRTFQGLEAYGLPAGPVDALNVEGILGADVLKSFAVTMDPAGRRWSLDASHLDDASLFYRPFVLDEGDAPVMTVSIDGRDLPALVDTGAQASIMNAAAAAALGLSLADPTARIETAARGTGPGATPSWSVCLPAFAYDGRQPEAVRMRVADLPVFAAVGLADRPAIILGYDHLGRGRIVIDYPASRIGFEQPSAAPAC